MGLGRGQATVTATGLCLLSPTLLPNSPFPAYSLPSLPSPNSGSGGALTNRLLDRPPRSLSVKRSLLPGSAKKRRL